MKFAHRFGPFAAAAAVLAVLGGIISSQAAGNSADSFAVDLNTAGNTASALGARDECAEAAAGTSIVVDVTATNVPAATSMVAYGFDLVYNPAVFTVSSSDRAGLLSTAPGYTEINAGDPLPDSDGTYTAGAANVTGTGASGSGYLQRLTLDIAAGAAAGGYQLTLTNAGHVQTQTNIAYPPDAVFGARVAVGVTCASLPTPTPSPSPTPCSTNCPAHAQGDVDCSGGVNSVDALKVLRHVASLSVTQNEPCDDINTGGPPLQGDVDCSNAVNSVDALKVLRHVASLSVTQNEPCDDIGT